MLQLDALSMVMTPICQIGTSDYDILPAADDQHDVTYLVEDSQLVQDLDKILGKVLTGVSSLYMTKSAEAGADYEVVLSILRAVVQCDCHEPLENSACPKIARK